MQVWAGARGCSSVHDTHLGLRRDAEDDAELADVVAKVDEHDAARLYETRVWLLGGRGTRRQLCEKGATWLPEAAGTAHNAPWLVSVLESLARGWPQVARRPKSSLSLPQSNSDPA